MRITDLLRPEGITLGASPTDKDAAIRQLVALQEKSGSLTDAARYREDILAREAQGTTAIGEGIAVPHAKSAAVKRPGLAAMTAPSGVDYGAPDGKPSRLFFIIAAPQEGTDVHLQMLARLMKLLMHEEFRASLISSKTPKEFLARIDEAERAKFPEDFEEEAPGPHPAAGQKEGYRILAVTACPTGIAHTYMAAEALEKTAAELGYTLKAETNGSGGVENMLTADEIAACDGIIVAADRNVEMARFNGRPVLKTSVSSGINKPAELIQRIIEGGVPVYHHDGAAGQADGDGHESAGRKLYKQLMNGVSHMLPFVIGGGILIALAFLLDDPSLGYDTFGTNTPVAAWFKTVGGAAFGFMLPILSGYIAMAIADRPGLMVGFVGGALAVSGATFASPGGAANSVSGFLGALIAGFAAGYLMLGLRKLCSYLPKALEGIKPVLIFPLAGLTVIALFMCAINPFVGMLNTALYSGLEAMGEGSKVLLGIVVAGMMAIDMGGPFNKAAYVFGASTLTAMAATGGSDIMAAVMIGGMVPPIAIALACTFFQNRFTPDERKSGLVNYIMGLCFITEGAIPFAASDPLRVIPACFVGSGVAGGLSMFFRCTLPAPHGGIFVFPVMHNILGYVIALLAGSVVGMVMLALLKKKKTEVK